MIIIRFIGLRENNFDIECSKEQADKILDYALSFYTSTKEERK